MRFHVKDASPTGGALILDGQRLELDEAGCIDVPDELLAHRMIARMIGEGRLSSATIDKPPPPDEDTESPPADDEYARNHDENLSPLDTASPGDIIVFGPQTYEEKRSPGKSRRGRKG